MNKKSVFKFVFVAFCSVSVAISSTVFAEHHGENSASEHTKGEKKQLAKSSKLNEKEKAKKDEIIREISYLAKKLLDITGQDSLVVESDEVMKPFLGVCSTVNDQGVRLNCITPDSQADKHGLQTGDILVSINGISMAKADVKEGEEHPYWGIMGSMKIGDVLNLNLLRGGDSIKIDVTVGSLSHPGYELKINR